MPLKPLHLWLVCSPVIAAVAAEEPERSPLASRLEEQVEVRAELPEEEEVAAFATTIETDRAAERAEDLADLLRRVPGARVRDSGGLGSYATVSLRASTAEQVTVLVDGVPQNRALGGPVDLSSIPASQIERIKVYRGFGPARFGLGGLGGVVDVRTRAAVPSTEASVDLLAGELETQRLAWSLSPASGGNGALRIGGEALRGDGDYFYLDDRGTPFNPSDDFERRRVNNEVEQWSLLMQQTWERGNEERLRVGLRLQRRDRGVPGLGNFQSETAALDEGLEDLSASWTRPGRGAVESWVVKLDGFRQTIDFVDREGKIGIDVQDQTTRLVGGGLDGLMRAAAGRQHFLVRLDLRREQAKVRDRLKGQADRGGADRDLLALTAEDLITLGRLTLAPSLRWEYLRNEFRRGGAGTIHPLTEDIADGNWAGKLGVAYRTSAEFALRGSVGRFHRNPNLLELFGDRGAVLGNSALDPESGETVELGLAWKRERPRVGWNVEAVGFGRRVDDLISLILTSQATSQPRNIATAEVYGLELSVAADWPWGLELYAAGTLQRATDTGFDEPIPLQPEEMAFLGCSFERRGWEGRWEMTYVGENSTGTLDEPAFRLPSRIVHDVALGFRWDRGVKLGVEARNLFDRQVRDLASYPLPARVLLVHLGWRLSRGKS